MTTPRTPGLRPLRLLLLLPCLSARLLLAQGGLDGADKAAHEWLALRSETVRLETDWQTQREVLGSLASTLREQAKLAEEKRDQAKAKTGQDREDLATVQAKIQATTDGLKAADSRLEALRQRLLALRPKLPPRLSDALDLTYRTLGSTTLSSTDRMQAVMNVLNRCGEFDRVVSVSQDVLTLEGEPPNKYFEVIYWGLNRGYAIDRSSRRAWLGAPGPDRWQWESKPEAYDAVVKLLAIANDKAEPDTVAAPAAVK